MAMVAVPAARAASAAAQVLVASGLAGRMWVGFQAFSKEMVRQQLDQAVVPTSYGWVWPAVSAIGLGVGAAAYKLLRRVEPEVVVDSLLTCPESLMPGSPLQEGGRVPSCQVQLAVYVDGKYVLVGAGIRVDDYLVTPAHNTQLGKDLYVMSAIHGNKPTLVQGEQLSLAPDLVAYQLPEQCWGVIAAKKVTMAPMGKKTTVQVTSSIDGKWSVGVLTPSYLMGRVTYLASTQPGFSGSAYMNGSTCMGIHVYGGGKGGQNGGYEALYVYNRLKHALRQIPESDYVINQAREEEYETEFLDDDSVLMRMSNGVYHLVTRGTYDAIQERWEGAGYGEDYDDPEEERDAFHQYVLDQTRDWEYEPEGAQARFSGECPPPGMGPIRRQEKGPERSRQDLSMSHWRPERPPTRPHPEMRVWRQRWMRPLGEASSESGYPPSGMLPRRLRKRKVPMGQRKQVQKMSGNPSASSSQKQQSGGSAQKSQAPPKSS